MENCLRIPIQLELVIKVSVVAEQNIEGCDPKLTFKVTALNKEGKTIPSEKLKTVNFPDLSKAKDSLPENPLDALDKIVQTVKAVEKPTQGENTHRRRRITTEDVKFFHEQFKKGESVSYICKTYHYAYPTVWNHYNSWKKQQNKPKPLAEALPLSKPIEKPAEKSVFIEPIPKPQNSQVRLNPASTLPHQVASNDPDIINCGNPKCFRRPRFLKGTGMMDSAVGAEFCTARCWQEFKENQVKI